MMLVEKDIDVLQNTLLLSCVATIRDPQLNWLRHSEISVLSDGGRGCRLKSF
jgi:hypothetical protein